jgi:hypothetical protein
MLAIANRDWELSLFVHVLGAMLLVGLLLAVLFALIASLRPSEGGTQLALTRFSFWTLVVGVVPSWLLMLVGAFWVEEEAPFDEDDAWIGIGHIVAEPVGLLGMLLAILFSGLALRRLRSDGSSSGFVRTATVFTAILVVAYLVAIWAMTTKPT